MCVTRASDTVNLTRLQRTHAFEHRVYRYVYYYCYCCTRFLLFISIAIALTVTSLLYFPSVAVHGARRPRTRFGSGGRKRYRARPKGVSVHRDRNTQIHYTGRRVFVFGFLFLFFLSRRKNVFVRSVGFFFLTIFSGIVYAYHARAFNTIYDNLTDNID